MPKRKDFLFWKVRFYNTFYNVMPMIAEAFQRPQQSELSLEISHQVKGSGEAFQREKIALITTKENRTYSRIYIQFKMARAQSGKGKWYDLSVTRYIGVKLWRILHLEFIRRVQQTHSDGVLNSMESKYWLFSSKFGQRRRMSSCFIW